MKTTDNKNIHYLGVKKVKRNEINYNEDIEKKSKWSALVKVFSDIFSLSN